MISLVSLSCNAQGHQGIHLDSSLKSIVELLPPRRHPEFIHSDGERVTALEVKVTNERRGSDALAWLSPASPRRKAADT